MEADVEGVRWGDAQVAVSGNVVTGNGPAAAAPFALAMVAESLGQDAADQVASGMLF
jgi:transcriptional regulator GlxA family with amidase domain